MPPCPGVHVELAELLALRDQARGLALRPRQVSQSPLAGQRVTRLRGRGLSFEELRPYWPGDDARLIDWKVTARLQRPFLRLFNEERDRPVLLLVDQRMNQFFGSRHVFKSVLAAQAAALLGWTALAQHDRIGAVLFGDQTTTDLRPARSERAFVHLLDELSRHNRALHAGHLGDAPERLNAVLEHAGHLARKDHLLILISDLHGLDAQTRQQLAQLRRHNDLMVCWTHDPLLSGQPPVGELVISDGHLQISLDLDRPALRQQLALLRDQRQQEILSWQADLGIPVVPLSSAEAAAPQLRQWLGRSVREQRLG